MAVYKSDKETAIAMVNVEEKVEYKVERKSGAAPDMDNAADMFKAGAKAMGKKVTEPDRDLETGYEVEKAKEKLG
ncbi:MAG TPA: hypothetical protein VHJ59_01840 [Nitrososphaera sp.]|nr:hypothetical protein [Nitrososphaera sp.]